MENKIGRWHGAGLLATTLLGSSVFILPQITINIAEHWAVLSWLLLTIAIVPVTFIFALLASEYPHAAGPAYFIEKAFGEMAGKTIGLMFLCAVPLGVPAGILITNQFFVSLFELGNSAQWLMQLSMLAAIFIINYRGVKVSATLQLAITLAITAVVVILIVLGYSSTSPSVTNDTNLLPTSFDPVFVAAGLAFWSFLGVEAMAHLSTDFKNPKKDLLPAMMFGTLLVGLIYIACTMLLLHFPSDSPVAMIDVFNQLLGGYGQWIIGILGIAGGFATVNVYTASAAKLLASFSDDKLLPCRFSQRNQHHVPVVALASLLTIMALVLTFTYLTGQSLEELIFWVNGVFILIYALSMFAAYKLLTRHKFLVTLSLAFCLVVIIGLGSTMLYALALALFIVPWLYLKQLKQPAKVA